MDESVSSGTVRLPAHSVRRRAPAPRRVLPSERTDRRKPEFHALLAAALAVQRRRGLLVHGVIFSQDPQQIYARPPRAILKSPVKDLLCDPLTCELAVPGQGLQCRSGLGLGLAPPRYCRASS
jgi:hypothetical protein